MPQFLILAKDFTDDTAFDRRMTARPSHLTRMKAEKEAGRFVTGGAQLNAEGKMIGSMVMVELPDEKAVREWIAQDPYIKDGVWETFEIIPYRTAVVD